MSAEPLVSIGMPVRNGDAYLRQALDSLLAQTYQSIEIHISDNASTDSTSAICSEYAQRDPRITHHRRTELVPMIANFNATLEAARGKYFMWAAHDDQWDPQFVSALVDRLQANPSAVLAFCKYDNIDKNGRPGKQFATDWGKVFAQPKVVQLCRFASADRNKEQHCNHIYGIMRTSVLRDRKGMETLGVHHYGCDFVTLFHLLGLGEFSIVSRVLFHYRFAYRDPAGTADLPHRTAIVRRLLRYSAGFGTFVHGNYLMFRACRKYVKCAPLGLLQRAMVHVTLTYAQLESVINCTARAIWWSLVSRNTPAKSSRPSDVREDGHRENRTRSVGALE